MAQILAIAWKNVYLTFRDRNSILIMIVTPLALATIIGFAFGGGGSGGVSIQNIPVALVNEDTGIDQNGTTFVYGDTITSILVPSVTNAEATPEPSADTTSTTQQCGGSDTSSNQSLGNLVTVTVLSDPAVARNGVDDGTYAAAILIPADFSQRLNNNSPDNQPLLEVYGSSGSPIRASIVRSIADGITSTIFKGVATVQSTIGQLVADAQSNPAFGIYFASVSALGTWQPDFSCAFVANNDPLTLQREALTATQTKSTFVQILISIGTAQAMFFALFTAQGGYQGIFEEKKAGTLPRLFVAPVPRRTILIGYFVGVFLTVLLQLVILILALTVVASVLEGTPQFIWGTNPLLVLALIAITLSVCGIGIFVISIVKSPQQSNVISSLLNTFFAFLGGTFGIALPAAIAGFSPIYWAVDALSKLANGSTEIGLNLLILVVQGLVMFIVGTYFFNRRELV